MKILFEPMPAERCSPVWKAFIAENPACWDKGQTQAEAMGNLLVTHPEEFGLTVDAEMDALNVGRVVAEEEDAAIGRRVRERAEACAKTIEPETLQLAGSILILNATLMGAASLEYIERGATKEGKLIGDWRVRVERLDLPPSPQAEGIDDGR